MDVGLKPILLKPVQFRPAMLSQTMRFPISNREIVLALIAEMQLKAAMATVNGEHLTLELCTLAMQNVLPMLDVEMMRSADDDRVMR